MASSGRKEVVSSDPNKLPTWIKVAVAAGVTRKTLAEWRAQPEWPFKTLPVSRPELLTWCGDRGIGKTPKATALADQKSIEQIATLRFKREREEGRYIARDLHVRMMRQVVIEVRNRWKRSISSLPGICAGQVETYIRKMMTDEMDRNVVDLQGMTEFELLEDEKKPAKHRGRASAVHHRHARNRKSA